MESGINNSHDNYRFRDGLRSSECNEHTLLRSKNFYPVKLRKFW
jgi:hypothetical protein